MQVQVLVRGKITKKRVRAKGREYVYYFVRIPGKVVKDLSLEEGEEVGLFISKIRE